MRIGMIGDTFLPQVGGAEIVMMELARRYREKGHVVEILTGSKGPRMIEGFKVTRTCNALHIHSSFRLPRTPFALIQDLNNFCKRQKVFHLHFDKLLSAMALRFVPGVARMSVATIHTLPSNCSAIIGPAWERRTVRSLSAYLTAVSAHAADLANSELGVKKVEFLPNGVDSSKFAPSKSAQNKDKFIILSPVRLRPGKRIKLVIDALPTILNRIPEAVLQIIGSGSEKATLQRRVRELGLEKNVDFLGLKTPDEMPRYLQNASVAVFPSEREGMPLAALEAMSCGVPVVTSSLPIFKVLVGDDERGISLDLEDRQSAHILLGKKIITLLLDINMRNKMGQAARNYVVKNNNWNSIADSYLEMFHNLVARSIV